MLDETTKNLLVVEVNKLLPENSENKFISAMRYVLLAPAKHIRSFLVIASSSIFNIKVEKAITAAAAIEFIHAYSLIHDDLPCMDNSDTRRGQLSCHKKFGEATAVLAGDALLTLAFEVLSSLNCEIIKVLSQAIGVRGMVGGQILDIDADLNKIKEIHLMKTAKLFAASCEIGAIIGNATTKERRALYNYGINLGLIFQAKDDIEDYEQDKTNNLMSVLGKNEMENYIDSLFKQASDNLSTLSGNTNDLYDLLNQVKKDG
ncbi:polyprenyl synthetase family protein [Wolbachia endosymbiont of Frankliniella intonsa]|uniref:polyprenyl synthetase family protein n=1 Tax=Wolbachia endosymbiont of Frankliniella intonsa TaxID=2902422 RepID=UPI00244E9C72|nr:polyprenyl synthetase family protein [Wolbachia endosymbiont of Frankliniella intonsa]WGJ62736.1 polyprenyl synthetase family protein [Wolbachia endosymbiont of Frankliniella intonsa]